MLIWITGRKNGHQLCKLLISVCHSNGSFQEHDDDDDDDDDILQNFTQFQKYSFVLRVELCVLPDRQNSPTVMAANNSN